MKNITTYSLFFLAVLLFTGCGPFRYIPENKKHLNRVDVKIENKSVPTEELYEKVSPKPNKRFLSFKFHMFLYDLSKPGKVNRFHNWLRKMGEEPVVWDDFQSKKSVERIETLLQHKGYFRAQVSDSAVFLGKDQRKVNVSYHVNPGPAYKIKRLQYQISDSVISEIVQMDSLKCLIRVGNKYDVSSIIGEKQRLKNLLLNKGYYSFIDEDINNYISFNIDTSLNKNVGITINIRDPKIGKHDVYKINNVYIFRNYNAGENLNNPNYFKENIDTLKIDNIYYLNKPDVRIKPSILSQSNYIIPGEKFNQQNEDFTIRHLRFLRVFQSVDITYNELKDAYTEDRSKLLDAYINLSPLTPQSLQYELALINSSLTFEGGNGIWGNIGGEAAIKYHYINLLGNAEILDVTIRGIAESFVNRDNIINENDSTVRQFNARSLGVETKLHIPKFLVPFRSEQFIKKYSPQTTIAVSYKYYDRPHYYLQNIANISFGYNWAGNKYTRFKVEPLSLNFVSIDTSGRGYFKEYVKGREILLEGFRNKMILSSQYSFEYTNEGKNPRHFTYFRLNMELAGNLLQLYAKNNESIVKKDDYYEIFGVPYSQFIKSDVDIRFYNQLTRKQMMAYRFFLGIAKPYGNSKSIPFERTYFSGGPNSVRAWKPYSLGPGTYQDTSLYVSRLEGSSDLKLEFNVEYRFDIFWKLKGALFVDGGNLWSLRKDFEGDTILKNKIAFNIEDLKTQIALGSGFGLRFDLDYLIIRFDWALKIYNPAGFNYADKKPYHYLGDNPEKSDVYTLNKTWIFKQDKIRKDDWIIQFGIAYPF